MYADDVVIYGKAKLQEVAVIIEILRQYTSWTRQELNFTKSSIHFSSNVNSRLRSQICRVLDMQECTRTCKYLGHSFCRFSSKKQEFAYIVDKIRQKMAGWKKRSLSMAGRIVLIKSLLQAIPSFVMKTFLMPSSVTKKIDSFMKDFFWGFNQERKHHLHLLSWKTITKSKALGGIGIRSMRDMN